MKTKLIILTSILITLIVGITILFSYSYFNANVNTSNTAIVNTTLPNGSYTFTTSNSGTISYTFTANKMLASASSTTAVASDDANVSVSLKSPDANTVVVCTYDLIWEWTGTDQYTTSDTTLPLTSGSNTYNYEMSVKGTSATTGAPSSMPSIGATLAETDLSKFTWTGTSGASGYKAVIVHNASIASMSTSTTVTNWDLTSSIYNIPAVQTKLQNKNFKAKIYVSNVDCNVNSKLPSGYTQVNYLQSSGTQYIDTGMNLTKGYSYEFSTYAVSNPPKVLFGANSSGPYEVLIWYGGNSSMNYLGGSFEYTLYLNTRYNMIINLANGISNLTYTLDKKVIRSVSGNTNNKKIYLFGGIYSYAGTDNAIDTYNSQRYYNFKSFYGNEMIRNFIPAINSSSVAGMYDTVTNTFYTNAGTGTFTTG